MVSVAIWLVSRGRNFMHALLVFADLGAENGFTPDECEAMQCVLGFAWATGENLTDVEYACVKEPGGGLNPLGSFRAAFLAPYHGPPRD